MADARLKLCEATPVLLRKNNQEISGEDDNVRSRGVQTRGRKTARMVNTLWGVHTIVIFCRVFSPRNGGAFAVYKSVFSREGLNCLGLPEKVFGGKFKLWGFPQTRAKLPWSPGKSFAGKFKWWG